MSETKGFERKTKEDKPVVAICYDFDKTLTPDDMQAQGFIQSIEWDTQEFWTNSNALASSNNMDQNLAWMYEMVREGQGKVWIKRNTLEDYGKKITFFPGVESWFERINAYADSVGLIVEHYIISSGLQEMIEGSLLGEKRVFEKVYASSFHYDEKGVADWPAQVVNFTNKTQFLFRIEKGVLDINDPGVNEYFEENQIRIPFSNMIYIGDSATDIPCMRLVGSRGGHPIGVYDSSKGDKTKVFQMMREDRIRYYVPANYEEGSELEELVKDIIDRTKENAILEQKHYDCLQEANEGLVDKEARARNERMELLASLDNSDSFMNTHSVVYRMNKRDDWEDNDYKEMCRIAYSNFQVSYILKDEDIAEFYKNVIGKIKEADANVSFVRNELGL